jgi:hypothetical protein
MAAPKGTRPPAAGIGRKPGSKNKVSANMAAAVLRAFDKAGGDEYLLGLAQKEPRVFGMLLSKLMPTQVTGADGDPLRVQAVANEEVLVAMRALIDQARVIGTPPPELAVVEPITH